MNDSLAARGRLLTTARGPYDPAVLGDSILALLEFMECISSDRPRCNQYRDRTGLLCAPEFRNYKKAGDVENAISEWVAEFYDNANSQVTDLVPSVRPDIVFSFKDEADEFLVVLEAKPVWQRWITTGEINYKDVVTDELGRTTGNYANKNISQVVGDRNKLFERYTHPNDRHMLLALVFQRPGELDDILIEAVGPDWSHRKRHIIDRCNPPGDNIGVTGMVFWPTSQS